MLSSEEIQQTFEMMKTARAAQQNSRTAANSDVIEHHERLAFANQISYAGLCYAFSSNQTGTNLSNAPKWKPDFLAAVAHYFQSNDAFEHCASLGMYAAASTIVRREMETVETCQMLLEGKPFMKSNPKIESLKHFGRLYGQFSSLAHSTGFDLMKHLAQTEDGISIDPVSNPAFTRWLLGVHIFCNCRIASSVIDLTNWETGKGTTEMAAKCLETSLTILLEEKILVRE